MQRSILVVICLLAIVVLAGCAATAAAPTSAVPVYDPRTPALDLSNVRPDEVCTYIGTYSRSIDQAMAIIKAAPTGDRAGLQRSADQMRRVATTFKGYAIPEETKTLGLSMAFVLAAYADMMQNMATGSVADMQASTRLATGLMSDTADAAHAVGVRHGCY